MNEPITLRDLQAIDVAVLKGIGDKRKSSLSDYGVENVLDLLTTYPRRWVDRTNEARVADLQAGQEALVIVEIRSVNKRPLRGGKTMVTVSAGDDTGRIGVVFFNQPWRAKQLQSGMQVAMFGKVDLYRGSLQMTNPVVDLIGNRTGRVVAIYPQSEKARLGGECTGTLQGTRHRRPGAKCDPRATSPDRSHVCIAWNPSARLHPRQRRVPSSARLR